MHHFHFTSGDLAALEFDNAERRCVGVKGGVGTTETLERGDQAEELHPRLVWKADAAADAISAMQGVKKKVSRSKKMGKKHSPRNRSELAFGDTCWRTFSAEHVSA